jgi:hypothetical protein
MSMTDPIADLLTRIRNAQSARKAEVSMTASKLKIAIVRVLKEEGYVADFRIDGEGAKRALTIGLKYYEARAREPTRPQNLSWEGRAPESPRGHGHRHRLDAKGRHDRPSGPLDRPGRRSAVHRGVSDHE